MSKRRERGLQHKPRLDKDIIIASYKRHALSYNVARMKKKE